MNGACGPATEARRAGYCVRPKPAVAPGVTFLRKRKHPIDKLDYELKAAITVANIFAMALLDIS